MHISNLLFFFTICLLACFVQSDSCKSCSANSDCQQGFYCCDGQCVQWPAIGEACPCSQCPYGLGCIEGRCIANYLNCSCNTASDCTFSSGGFITDCINNKCQQVSSSPPFSYFTPGGTCNLPQCQSNYCNANNECDYIPVGTACTHTYYCQPGSGCFDNICQPFKLVGEECQYDLQCPSGYVCRASSSVLPATCTTKGESGEYCSDLDDCNRMFCKNNVCTYPARGEICPLGRCGPEDACDLYNICIAKNSVADGGACSSALQCQSSLCNGVCLPISTLGGYCNITAQCPNGQCINHTCYQVAFSGETCNSTHVCYNPERPCHNGVCPYVYSALGESCTTDAECAVGRCSNGVCDYPLTCQVAADCGRNLACDCGECTFLRDNNPIGEIYNLYYLLFSQETRQLTSRSPERDCITNMVLNSDCEPIIAKYYCYSTCYSLSSFFNAIPSSVRIDCATLRVLSLNVTKQPCCSADSQTDCADTISNCLTFRENQIKPFITRPNAPITTPQVATPTVSAPTSTPSGVAPQAPTAPSTPSAGAPQSVPSSAPTSAPVNAPQASTPMAAPTSQPNSNAPQATSPSTGMPSSAPTPLATPTRPTCNCAEPTPLCDQELAACVGLRVVPVVQCVERTNNQYTAYMTYINEQSSSVLMSDAINFLNINVPNKVSQFEPGRQFSYPQSAFNIITTSAQEVSWYLDGFKLVFDIDNQDLLCPQDVTFQMTSTATIDQLLAISDSLIGNLSDVMQVALSRLNVTFSASTKRQTTSSVITVVVKADQNSEETSSQVVLEFVESGFATFKSRVPAAAIASVSTLPPANEQSGSAAVSPPTNPPTTVSAPSDRGFISGGTTVLANIALLGSTFLLF